LPATAQQRRRTFTAVAVLFAALFAVAPFAKVRLPEGDGFIPAIQAVIVVTDLTTAVLLFIAVEIQDTGPGIDPTRLGGIFDAFVTTKPHGTGLGLAICRMIIEHHGGKLTAASDGASGAHFEFVLPMLAVGRAAGPGHGT
jgi:signal transduction histidine kinase